MPAPRTSCRRAPALVYLLVLACGLAAAPPVGAQGRERVIYVSALEKGGKKPAETLAPSDVAVREDGVAREVLRVARATEPMQIALLVDNSAASTSHIANLRDGLTRFVNAIEGPHEISLITYADRPTLVTSFSSDHAEVLRGIDRLFAQPGSGAYLLDAIHETTRGFIRRESPRPVIVVVGMEAVEFSNLGYESVLEQLAEAHAQLHVLVLTDSAPDTSQEERYRGIVIDRGTRATGGRRDNLLSSMAFREVLPALAAELNGQFRVVYARPESLIPPRATTVTSANPALEVRGVPARPPK